MDVRLTWTGCDEAGDYVVSNVLSPRDLVSRPDNMDETVIHTEAMKWLNGKKLPARLTYVPIVFCLFVIFIHFPIWF